ncbi:hypothetical protein ABZ297_14580 [Nonomuraea sp. NPDC005983]|uniref:hypothetical protein n=1 Tax=Nonomuraea sp. NPDC005983 TaxID=3155595 RepID=UPI0033BBA4A3
MLDSVITTASFSPAHRLGIRRVWINRLGERPDDPSVPQDVLPDLRGLPGVVAS